MSALRTRIEAELKTAMKAREQARVSTMRLITAAIKQREVDERIEIEDAHVIEILSKMAKQRRESIEQFEAGNRQDLADIEHAELALIQNYLPQPLSNDEISALIDEAIAAVGLTGMQAMGKVMGHIKPQIQGRADGKVVSDMVKQKLQDA